MAIDLQDYSNGDTDYIAKLNSNNNKIEQAIQQMETQVGAVGAGASAGLLMNALFNGADAIIGPDSYKPVLSASTATVKPGSAYLSADPNVVTSGSNVPLSFVGLPSGTYYIRVDTAGFPYRNPTHPAGGNLWGVNWDGTAFTTAPFPVANIFYDSIESTASRKSTGFGDLASPPGVMEFPTLDARLEAIEESLVVASIPRKIGCTVGNSVGVKGAIQIDFAGTIIGWSIIADGVGSIAVEISRASSGYPPAAPGIPDPSADKISASAPVQLIAAQSATGGEAEVDTWDTGLDVWDVIQFKVASVSGALTNATLYLRVRPTGLPGAPPPPAPPIPELPSPPDFEE